jgi:hypothetical protein
VVGLGEGEGGVLGAGRERLGPALLLLLGAQQHDRTQREPALHADHGADAPVDAGELHVDQARGERGEGAVPGHVQAVGEQVELAEAGDQLDRVLAAVPPVVDAREHLVGERAGVGPGLQVLAADVLEQGEVVRGGGQQRLRGRGARVGGGDDGAVRDHGVGALAALVGPGVAAEGDVPGRGGVPAAGAAAGVGRAAGGGVVAGHHLILSMMRAMPWPPPTHRVARP